MLYRPILDVRGVICQSHGRLVLVEFALRGSVFREACVYAPNRNPDRDEFFAHCETSIDLSAPTVLCGDFNTVFDRTWDRRVSNIDDAFRESSPVPETLFRECCVSDIWRVKHPDFPGFTWDRPDGSLSSRIDLIGCPYAWIPFVTHVDVIPCPYSDHSALSFGWTIPGATPLGPGRWKLNVSILSNEAYQASVGSFWSSWLGRKASSSSLSFWWEAGKGHLKGLAIRHCLTVSSDSSMERSLLKNLAAHLKARIDYGHTSLPRCLSFRPVSDC